MCFLKILRPVVRYFRENIRYLVRPSESWHREEPLEGLLEWDHSLEPSWVRDRNVRNEVVRYQIEAGKDKEDVKESGDGCYQNACMVPLTMLRHLYGVCVSIYICIKLLRFNTLYLYSDVAAAEFKKLAQSMP